MSQLPVLNSSHANSSSFLERLNLRSLPFCSYTILIKRWLLSIFSISTFAASIKLLLGFVSACYPERRRKTSLDGSAELCYCTFSTAVYGCNNKANFMTPTRGMETLRERKIRCQLIYRERCLLAAGFTVQNRVYGQNMAKKMQHVNVPSTTVENSSGHHHLQLKLTWRL